MRIALIMLAAGNSRRFGGNKLLYEIDGNPMYRYILERLIAVAGAGGQGKEVSSCVLETGSLKNIKQEMTVTVVTQYEEIEEEARALGVPVYNPHPDEGISSSLKIGLKANLDADACLLLYPISPGLQPGRSASLLALKPQEKELPASARQAWQPSYFYKENIATSFLHHRRPWWKIVTTAHRDDTAVLLVEGWEGN